MRIEYIAPGRFLLPTQFNVTQFTELIGTTVLAVLKDGIGYTKVLVTNDFQAPMPTGTHARFNPTLGTIALPTLFEPGEVMVVLYQPNPTPCQAPYFSPILLLAAVPNAYYSAMMPLNGFAPFIFSSVTKPAWMDISISGSYIVFSGTPSLSDVGSHITVYFLLSNACGIIGFYSPIDVSAEAVYVTKNVMISGNRTSKVMRAFINGTPGISIVVQLSTFINTNGGSLYINGAAVSVGQIFNYVLNASGNATILTDIEGLPVLGTKMTAVFTIISVSAGAIGSPNYFSNSKIF